MACTCLSIFLLSSAWIAIWLQEMPLPALPISTPQLVGVPLSAAKERLAAQGLNLEIVDERPSEQYPKGVIIKQASDGWAGAMKRVLRVTVSAGLVVPNLVDLTQVEAQAMAARLGWTLIPSGGVPANPDIRVRMQYPAPGSSANAPGEISVAFDE
jgi:beta-lactam-binding protein with PASTA domain